MHVCVSNYISVIEITNIKDCNGNTHKPIKYMCVKVEVKYLKVRSFSNLKETGNADVSSDSTYERYCISSWHKSLQVGIFTWTASLICPLNRLACLIL